jgi:hypothetical protein
MRAVVYGRALEVLDPEQRARVTVRVWVLRLVWASLPFVAGPGAGEAVQHWSTAPQRVAATLLWLAWGVALVATAAPRPIGLTALRVISPAFVALGVILAVRSTASSSATGAAVAGVVLAFALVESTQIAQWAVNGVAYGDERRFPLTNPPGLYLGPVPLARAIVAAGIAAGPLLLADGRIGLGIAALVVGMPLAATLSRALHTLSRRLIVLVPAGLVIVDPMTLADPVLLTRERIRALSPAALPAQVNAAGLDLRLGATFGSVALSLDREGDIMRRRSRRASELLRARDIVFAAQRRRELLATAGDRRIRVR